jgi:hypothetical protein
MKVDQNRIRSPPHSWRSTLRSNIRQGASPATRRAELRGLDRRFRSG